MSVLATVLLLALTRAEIIARMKAPVITQCEGLVQVYADCPEDMRREYQMPIASFAAETVKTLYRGLAIKPKRYKRAGIMIHVGDVRTNDTSVVARAATNGTRVVNRIYVKSPGFADLDRFKLEIIKAFGRVVLEKELDDAGAVDAYRKADPQFRIANERRKLDEWLAGTLPSPTPADDDKNLALMRKVFEPGVASRTDIRIFASRLFLYPLEYDSPFCGKYHCLSFREAVNCMKDDPYIRVAAYRKSSSLIIFGGGRGETLSEASKLYFEFLLEMAKGEMNEGELLDMLDAADTKLNLAFEEAKK